MPWLRSASVSTASASAGAVKLGQPQWESNFSPEVKSASPQPAQRKVPCSFVALYSPLNGLSVPFCRSTWYCSGVSSRRHSASVFSIFSAMPPLLSSLLSPPDRRAAPEISIVNQHLGPLRQHQQRRRAVGPRADRRV